MISRKRGISNDYKKAVQIDENERSKESRQEVPDKLTRTSYLKTQTIKQMKYKNRYLFIGLMFLFGIIFIFWSRRETLVGDMFSFAETQTEVMLKAIKEKGAEKEGIDQVPVSPRTLNAGDLVLVPSKDWTSGFFPGELWFLYEYTQDEFWRKQAEEFTRKVEQEKLNGVTHDMGFKINCSFGNGYRLTKNDLYKDVIIQSAKTLMTRFNPTVGSIRSWDHSTDKWDFPVIIDNMMNLELLFLATRLTGDSSFYKIAVTHAQTTMKNHYREDYSSYHVIDYDTVSGKVVKKNTHQGYSHESAWSRGQAWGLYGYTMCYRETKDKVFLEQAEKIAKYILDHPNLPEDLIPYWDFDAPKIPDEPRDVSAAAIMASGLYELSTFTANGDYYLGKADEIIETLATNYVSKPEENKGFILGHSTGSKPGNSEIDVPLIYADYYFLEALLRKEALNKNSKL